MAESSKQSQRPKLGQFVPFRSSSGEIKPPEKSSVDIGEIRDKVNNMIDLASVKQLGGIAAVLTGEGPRPPAGSAKNDMESVANVAKILGVDISKMTESREKELESLRTSRDASQREIHEMRLALYDKSFSDMKAKMDEFMKEIRSGGNQPQGLFGVADQILGNDLSRTVLSKALGINQPPQEPPKDALDTLLDALSKADRIKSALGVHQEDRSVITNAALQNAKVETIKLLLEDSRQRESLESANSIAKMKVDKLGGFLETITNAIPDVIEAWGASRGGGLEAATAAAGKIRKKLENKPARSPAMDTPRDDNQAQNEDTTTAPAGPRGDPQDPSTWTYLEETCPHPDCQKVIPFPNELPADMAWTCPYCKKPIQRAPSQPQSPQRQSVNSEEQKEKSDAA